MGDFLCNFRTLCKIQVIVDRRSLKKKKMFLRSTIKSLELRLTDVTF